MGMRDALKKLVYGGAPELPKFGQEQYLDPRQFPRSYSPQMMQHMVDENSRVDPDPLSRFLLGAQGSIQPFESDAQQIAPLMPPTQSLRNAGIEGTYINTPGMRNPSMPNSPTSLMSPPPAQPQQPPQKSMRLAARRSK